MDEWSVFSGVAGGARELMTKVLRVVSFDLGVDLWMLGLGLDLAGRPLWSMGLAERVWRLEEIGIVDLDFWESVREKIGDVWDW